MITRLEFKGSDRVLSDEKSDFDKGSKVMSNDKTVY